MTQFTTETTSIRLLSFVLAIPLALTLIMPLMRTAGLAAGI